MCGELCGTKHVGATQCFWDPIFFLGFLFFEPFTSNNRELEWDRLTERVRLVWMA